MRAGAAIGRAGVDGGLRGRWLRCACVDRRAGPCAYRRRVLQEADLRWLDQRGRGERRESHARVRRSATSRAIRCARVQSSSGRLGAPTDGHAARDTVAPCGRQPMGRLYTPKLNVLACSAPMRCAREPRLGLWWAAGSSASSVPFSASSLNCIISTLNSIIKSPQRQCYQCEACNRPSADRSSLALS